VADDQALVAKHVVGVTDGHDGDAVGLGELAGGREPVTRLVVAVVDRCTQLGGELLIGRAGVVEPDRHSVQLYYLYNPAKLV
jgi:hypothetical protein